MPTKTKPKTKTMKTKDFTITRLEKSKELNGIAKDVHDIVHAARGMTVKDNAEKIIVTKHLEDLNRGLKEMDSIRLGFVQPIKAAASNIDKWFREKTAPMRKADQILRLTINTYLDAEEARIAAETAKREKEHAAENEEATELGGAPIAAPAALAPVDLKTEGSSSSAAKVLVIEIFDISRVPAEFLLLNESAVKQAHKAGRKEIPGLLLKMKNKLTVR